MDKKEIKNLYKMKPPDMGVYQLKNLANGMIYIGSAMDLKGKLNSERFQLMNNMHMNRELQKDFNELGGERFSFEVLDRLLPKGEPGNDPGPDLRALEELWMEKLRPYGARGYHKRKSDPPEREDQGG
jgi:hypothetical protein